MLITNCKTFKIMELINVTGVTKTDLIREEKTFGALFIQTNCSIYDLTNETLTLYVQRGNGNNDDIAQQVPLIDIFLLGSFGQNENIFTIDGTHIGCVVEVAKEGAIHLRDKESIRLKLESLKPAKDYIINGLEEPVTTPVLTKFQVVEIQSEASRNVTNVEGFDLVCISNVTELKELDMVWSNGNTTKYTLPELRAKSVTIDPVMQTAVDGTVKTWLSDKLVLPLVGVKELRILKTAGQIMKYTLLERDFDTHTK